MEEVSHYFDCNFTEILVEEILNDNFAVNLEDG